jgi:DNA segregation ATPase FtsK/SpoIIIE-like protein
VSEEVVAVAQALDSAMEKYRLAAEPFQPELADVGPNVIRFRTRPLGPLSVNDIERRARDLGREVGAPGGVIVSQEPRYICIDVPRAERQPVLYTDLVPRAPVEAGVGGLGFIVGVAPSGEVRAADLARLPHLLVAGATGSGKSVFLRAMLCHLVRTHGPAALRILLIDPKGLDFAGFETLPHLVSGRAIADPSEAVEALKATIEREVERRRPILVEAGVTSATEFFERGGSSEQLPQMVVLVDEFADLAAVMERQERRGFQELIQRYAQITRAFGIYLVLATQRPSVDVITGSIKANLTARVAFSLPSHRDSMTVLDRAGAEDLLGNGDLLFYVNGRVERLQGALVTANDVAHAAERWRGVANPDAER